ncbi:MAG: LysM peptidoglycan-binding domain-containing protein [Bacteroidia bacterium]|nr:LysM peptidoglycan-binding domain-containing protein [Bacteroidia bacterium]
MLHTGLSKYYISILFLLISLTAFSQRIQDKVIDTFEIKTGKIILFENHKWMYPGDHKKDTAAAKTDKNYFDSQWLIKQDNTTYKNSQPDKNFTKKNDQTEKATIHIVKKGDTLLAIARKYKTSVNALCALNNIGKTATLRLGQKIKVR